jgi:hypothetical protein
MRTSTLVVLQSLSRRRPDFVKVDGLLDTTLVRLLGRLSVGKVKSLPTTSECCTFHSRTVDHVTDKVTCSPLSQSERQNRSKRPVFFA